MYTMKTTINGQLLLLMLSERFVEEISSVKMLQINTDGMTIKVKRSDKLLVESIVKRWENLTKLQMEYTYYSKMIIKDVNNYIAIKTDGGIKRKGAAFIYKVGPGELELHKNFSMLIIPKAIEAYFVKGIKPEEFVKNHDDIYDFFKRTKINKSDKLFEKQIDFFGKEIYSKETQRINRYYISGKQKEINLNSKLLSDEIVEKFKDIKKKYGKIRIYPIEGNGKILLKEMKPLKGKSEKRYTNMESGYLCTSVNNLDAVTEQEIRDNIYYPYYINEVYKVINQIENDK